MSSIQLYENHWQPLEFNHSIFPGGEIHIRLKETCKPSSVLRIVARLTDSNGILSLMQLKAALDMRYPE